MVTSTCVAPACRAALESDSRSAVSRCSVISSGTMVSSAPSSCSEGANPSAAAISCATKRTLARSAAGLASGWVWSAKIAERISLIVSSSASTDRLIRSATSGTLIIEVTPCSDMPVAYSRWMTRSCRSLAIRSRSSKTAICSACLRCSASSSPMAAWAAKVASMSAAA